MSVTDADTYVPIYHSSVCPAIVWEHVCELERPGANMTLGQGRYVHMFHTSPDALSKEWFSSLQVRVDYLPRNLIPTSLSASLFR